MKLKMEEKDIEAIYEQAENFSDRELERIIAHMENLLMSRHVLSNTYEDEFINVMLKCGLDRVSAEKNLRDFKVVSAMYISKAEPLFIEDVQQVLEMVLCKNGYIPNTEAKNMLRIFFMNSFGKNIPSMKMASV